MSKRITIGIDYADIEKALKDMEKDGFLAVIQGDKLIIRGKPKRVKEKVQFT